jgi:ADP-heptose:LPS heptosyltransferase
VQAKMPNMPVVLIGGPDDRKLIAALTELQPKLKVVNPPDIGKLAALIASANLLLCTDSAPMHIGVAVGTALVALFGPTDPAQTCYRAVTRLKQSSRQKGNRSARSPRRRFWRQSGHSHQANYAVIMLNWLRV